MFATLDLTWKPTSASDVTPPAGKAPAIVREDTYVHVIRITDGWLNDLQDYSYAAQLRPARLTSSTADAATAAFTIQETQDGDDLLLILTLSSSVTAALPTTGLYWDLQSVAAGDVKTTLLAGKVKVLDDVTRVA